MNDFLDNLGAEQYQKIVKKFLRNNNRRKKKMVKSRDLPTEYYKVGYYLGDHHRFATYFTLEAAQESMMRMIERGVRVTGLASAML